MALSMSDRCRRSLPSSLAPLGVALALLGAVSGPPATAQDEYPEFTEDFLSDPENIEHGQELWADQCRHCHGRSSYPGKGPKLSPGRYEPDFVYARIAYGFGKMPAWEDTYSQEEIKDLVAFIMSDDFSP